mmetsp:Transcript_51430/g.103327  ORF Transcript_51430/g.103327 Transcript_51430/m.103327 type:complete len:505 (+) Transcript_51430:149-1663(+)
MSSLVASPLWLRTLLRSPKVRKTTCKKHFKEFDANGDGHLDETELSQLCEAVCRAMGVQPFQAPEVHGSFQRFDRDNSGGLEYDEFAQFFEHLLTVMLRRLQQEEPCGASAEPPLAGGDAEASARGGAGRPAGGIEVCLRTLAGNPVASLGGFAPSDRVADLCARLAESAGKPRAAFQVLHGATALKAASSFEEAGVVGGSELTVRFLAASEIVERALEALEACPEGEPGDYSGFRRPPQESKQQHEEWCSCTAPLVTEALEALCGMADERCEDARRLAFKCLQLPAPMLFMSDVKPGCPVDELYPDELTFAAAHLLPSCSTATDDGVAEALEPWVGRLRTGGELTTSTWTLDEVLKILPGLTPKPRRAAIVEDLDKALGHLVGSLGASAEWRRGRPFATVTPSDAGWWIKACYTAILKMLPGHGKPLQAPRFLLALASQGAGVEGVDMEELLDFAKGLGVCFKEEQALRLGVGLEHWQQQEEDWLQEHECMQPARTTLQTKAQ